MIHLFDQMLHQFFWSFHWQAYLKKAFREKMAADQPSIEFSCKTPDDAYRLKDICLKNQTISQDCFPGKVVQFSDCFANECLRASSDLSKNLSAL